MKHKNIIFLSLATSLFLIPITHIHAFKVTKKVVKKTKKPTTEERTAALPQDVQELRKKVLELEDENEKLKKEKEVKGAPSSLITKAKNTLKKVMDELKKKEYQKDKAQKQLTEKLVEVKKMKKYIKEIETKIEGGK